MTGEGEAAAAAWRQCPACRRTSFALYARVTGELTAVCTGCGQGLVYAVTTIRDAVADDWPPPQ